MCLLELQVAPTVRSADGRRACGDNWVNFISYQTLEKYFLVSLGCVAGGRACRLYVWICGVLDIGSIKC